MTYTLHDVQPGPLPGLVAAGPEGSEYLIHLTVELPEVPASDKQRIVFDVEIRELKADRKGRAFLKTLSSPRIATLAGTPASLRQGARIPIPGTQPVAYQEVGLALELTYLEEDSQEERMEDGTPASP